VTLPENSIEDSVLLRLSSGDRKLSGPVVRHILTKRPETDGRRQHAAEGSGPSDAAHRAVQSPSEAAQKNGRYAMRVLKSFWIVLLMCAVLSSTAFAAATTPQKNDEMLANDIAKQVRNYVFYTIYDDVEGSVHDGVVTLTGKVTMPYKAKEIGDLVARVPGVREVDNKISTLPVSTFDDRLRVAIASQIYRDPLFWNYAIQVNPPIHVVVENGHVTLTGVVNSEVERRKAETVARTTFGVFSVDNKLRLDSEMRSTQ
jgi:osmotically-inducible protein OsmY